MCDGDGTALLVAISMATTGCATYQGARQARNAGIVMGVVGVVALAGGTALSRQSGGDDPPCPNDGNGCAIPRERVAAAGGGSVTSASGSCIASSRSFANSQRSTAGLNCSPESSMDSCLNVYVYDGRLAQRMHRGRPGLLSRATPGCA